MHAGPENSILLSWPFFENLDRCGDDNSFVCGWLEEQTEFSIGRPCPSALGLVDQSALFSCLVCVTCTHLYRPLSRIVAFDVTEMCH